MDERTNDLDRILARDRGRVIALARRLQRARDPEVRARLQEERAQIIAASHAAWQARLAARPEVTYPPELPVSQKADAIAAAIRAHRVVIVCGETGSGKTTQLPKICLAAGRGISGQIAHTQPRRIAARVTAARIAEELGESLGRSVGFRVRFHDVASPHGYITLMTDGILLAETQRDPWLSAYDTIIIDEAHERSLNIDFLLGYLHRLLARRPDLKVIVTSATLDAARFARHFETVAGAVPIIEVSGRLHPVTVRYRPIDALEESEEPLYDGIVACVAEAWQEGPGDILVFLPGEREIREARAALEAAHATIKREFEIIPLFARQSPTEQARVFARSKRARIVLATNVAETSLTVPNIRYVIDSGLARIHRYNPRTRVAQLKIEPISQAAAQQRAGRCGRVMDGVCFRLYSESDFAARAPHTDPEILRTSLSAVVLRMAALRLGEIQDFPFLDPPPYRAVQGAYQELIELGALDPQTRNLTPVGTLLARLPIDPHLARLLVAGHELGCLKEMRILAAALSVPDPRVRPGDREAQADPMHARFRGSDRDAKSEFCWYLNLWSAWQEVIRHESGNKQRQWAQRHFLSWLRLREWREVEGQLHALTGAMGWRDNEQPATYEVIHTALLTALPHGVGQKARDDKPELRGSYLGAKGVRFWLHPQSGPLRRAQPAWVLAAERVETTKPYARTVAAIDSRWIERAVPHLIVREVGEPHWNGRAGEVRGLEKGTLFGLTVYSGRPVSYRHVDPALCRTLFIREGLVAGNLPPQRIAQMPFLQHNLALVAELRELEQRLRRPDLVDEGWLEAFYASKIPEDVVDLASFESWRRSVERSDPKLLFLTREMLLSREAEGVVSERFPATFDLFGQPLPLHYVHDPAARDDGVTLTVPVALLNQIPAARCEWLVPGMLEEKVLLLIKSLPNKHKHRLQPHAESVQAFLADCATHPEWRRESLTEVLARWVQARTELATLPAHFRLETLPAHCFMNFRVVDAHGRVLRESRQLDALKQALGQKARGAFAALAEAWRAHGRNGAASAGTDENASAGSKTGGEPTDAPDAKGRANQGARRDGGASEPRETRSTAPLPEGPATEWIWPELPEIAEAVVAGVATIGFPALDDAGSSGARLKLFDTETAAAAAHRRGVLRLLRFALKEAVRSLTRSDAFKRLSMVWLARERPEALEETVIEAALQEACLAEPLPRTGSAFAERVQQGREKFLLVADAMMRAALGWFEQIAAIEKRLERIERVHPEVVTDIRAQLAALTPPGFLARTPWARLQHYTRYLKAIVVRLDKLEKDPARDRRWLAEWQRAALPWQKVTAKARGAWPSFWAEYRWLLEELRVGLFASELKTPMPVSIKRLERLWAQQGHG
ncbi:ATP-dependent RNA helicase HrpA [Hydrogenophilus hirschii]